MTEALEVSNPNLQEMLHQVLVETDPEKRKLLNQTLSTVRPFVKMSVDDNQHKTVEERKRDEFAKVEDRREREFQHTKENDKAKLALKERIVALFERGAVNERLLTEAAKEAVRQ